VCHYKIIKTSGQVSPGRLSQAAPPGPITDRQKSSPLVPLGLHSLFACLRTINPAVVFSVTLFAILAQFGTLFFIVPQKNQ